MENPAGFDPAHPRCWRSGGQCAAAPVAGAAGGAAGRGATDATLGGTGIADRESAKNWLIANGVQFNGNASAVYIVKSSRLIVRNTQDQLDLIETIIQSGSTGTGPVQVEIESKFVEIQQDNLRNWPSTGCSGRRTFPATKTSFSEAAPRALPRNSIVRIILSFAPGLGPVGSAANSGNPNAGNLTAGNRSGTAAISANAIDALLFPVTGASSLAPAIGAISGVFSDPQFQLVIRALNQKKGVHLLSSPKVTTKSGQRAVIEIIREFRYPTEFTPPQIPQTFGGGGGIANTVTATSSTNGSFPVTPTTPTAFETRNTGVTLEVEPVVGPDGYTIDLNLVPQVVEFEGFINYGSPIHFDLDQSPDRCLDRQRHHAQHHQPADLQHAQGHDQRERL